MEIYQPLQTKDIETGLWYKKWEIPDGMPIPDGMVLVSPPETLFFPRWDYETGVWIEDKDSIIESLKKDNKELKESNELLIEKTDSHDEQITQTQMAVAEVFEMVIGGDE